MNITGRIFKNRRILSTMVITLFFLGCLSNNNTKEKRTDDNQLIVVGPGEGLYNPFEIELPNEVKANIPKIVRIGLDIQFDVTLYTDSKVAQEARSVKGATDKIFLDDGAVIWPTIIDTTTLHSLCNSKNWVQPGFYELCQAFKTSNCVEYPCTIRTKHVEGTGTGFIVHADKQHLVIATNYHVAREAIERAERTTGIYEGLPLRAKGLDIRISRTGVHKDYEIIEAVNLLANASEQDWQDGKDWALLSVDRPVPFKNLESLEIAPSAPQVGDTLYALGFPSRTNRILNASNHYSNANNDLRVSIGIVTNGDSTAIAKSNPTDILATMDVVAGSSGSPVLNTNGEVVGIIRHHTNTNGEIDLGIVAYDGVAQIVPIHFISEILRK